MSIENKNKARITNKQAEIEGKKENVPGNQIMIGNLRRRHFWQNYNSKKLSYKYFFFS